MGASTSSQGADLTPTALLPARTPIRNDIDRKADMVRTIVYLLVATVLFGTIAAPGLAGFALVVVPLLGLGFLWRLALTVSTHGRPIDAVVHTRQSHLLGPGGPDDSFAAIPLDEDEYLTEASARASVSARNGLVRENSIQGGGG